MTTKSENGLKTSDMPETYVEMVDDYVSSQPWITSAELPLVFHARKLATQLDNDLATSGSTQAAKDSAYLQAIERLAKRRPTETRTVTTSSSEMPGQTDVFDYLDA